MRMRSTARLLTAATVLALSPYGLATAPAATVAPPAAACEPNPSRSLSVTTVPRVRGFVFRVGDRRYRTDRSGNVAIAPVTCPDPGAAIAPITEAIEQGGGRTTATFDAWYGAEQLARQGGDGVLYAAFTQQVRVRLDLEDLDGRPVARAAVGTIVLRGSTGAEVEVPPGRSFTTLDASRVVHLSNRLVSKDILWSVQSADVEGNTAVNRGQVRFEPRRSRVVTVPLILFELEVEVRDALLHRTVGEEVTLSSPNGSTRTIELDSHGNGHVSALARGHYVLRAGGASIAMAFEQPLAVSRSQVAQLRVISHLDVAIAACAFLSTVVGLLLVGWRLRVRAARRGDAPQPEKRTRVPAPNGERPTQIRQEAAP